VDELERRNKKRDRGETERPLYDTWRPERGHSGEDDSRDDTNRGKSAVTLGGLSAFVTLVEQGAIITLERQECRDAKRGERTETSNSLGFWRPLNGSEFGGESAFGTPGAGDSFTFADLNWEFSRSPIWIRTHVLGAPRELQLRRAVEMCLND
jgi:hypothetical protein